MSFWKVVKRSLVFHWRTNLGVLLGVTAGTAVLVGAMLVGDSVRHSLELMVASRLGATQLALTAQDRFFTEGLAAKLASEVKRPVSAVLQSRGLLANSDGTKRVNRVEVLGVDESFYEIGSASNPFDKTADETVVLNESLAERLGVAVGDEVVLRIGKPGRMPRDIPLMPDSDLSASFRLTVGAIVGESGFGRFGLEANHVAPLNVFVPIEWLQEKLEQVGRANVLLVGANSDQSTTTRTVSAALKRCWGLADAGISLSELDHCGELELRSRRVFIENSVATAAMAASDEGVGVLTYFVNEIRSAERATPYSMVSAMSPADAGASVIRPGMADDEIIVNRWLADDLAVKEGDTISLTYYVIGAGRGLLEQVSELRVRGIVAMEGIAGDAGLMPDFPGLAEVDDCREWQPGIPIDLDRIRKRDEDYWSKYRGTPKAFVTLGAGQKMWANRYGELTAVRYPLQGGSSERVGRDILDALDPASLGLYFRDVRAMGLAASAQGGDFGVLFAGFSMFLIAAAVVLTGLCFVLGVERRGREVGMLRAVGFSPRQVAGLLLLEGGVIAAMGAIAGTAAGFLYSQAMIGGLGSIWRQAVSGSAIVFHAELSTLVVGTSGGMLVSLIAICLGLRKHAGSTPRELLDETTEGQFIRHRPGSRGGVVLWLAIAAVAAAVVLVVWAQAGEGDSAAGVFFGAGSLLLVGGIAFCQVILRMAASGHRGAAGSLVGLGLRNAARRCGRSLAVLAMLACGIFLVVAVGANRRNPSADWHKRSSGTGGYALYGESAMGILHDLNGADGRRSLGFDDGELGDARFVQLRVRDGDDASCFNLNRPQNPRLLGVDPERLAGSFLFTKSIGSGGKKGWELLDCGPQATVVLAVGDSATITWALGRSVGDELQYTDERGREFRVRLVGMLKDSVFQGSLVTAEEAFIELFPSESGYRMLLVDTAEEDSRAISELLSQRLRDFGLDVISAGERLAAFSAVENTYLSIFQLLGGLGLIVGSIGLGIVVLRNVLDRRSELAMLRAVGFSRRTLKLMVFHEHAGLLLGGLVLGVVTALAAVSPTLRSPGADVPYLSLSLTAAAIVASGFVWIWTAASFSLSGELLDALRSE